MWGPRLEQVLRHSIMALIETPNASLALLPRLLTDADFRARVLSRVTNPLTRAFFEQRFNTWRDDYREQAIDPVLNKIDAFFLAGYFERHRPSEKHAAFRAGHGEGRRPPSSRLV